MAKTHQNTQDKTVYNVRWYKSENRWRVFVSLGFGLPFWLVNPDGLWYRRKAKAVAIGRDWARAENKANLHPTQLLIRRKDGLLQHKHTYR